MTDVVLPTPVLRPPNAQPDIDAAALHQDLAEHVDGEVRFDPGTRGAYSTDASNFRQVPIGVVVPRSVDAGVAAIEVCRRHGAPIVSRGGGTSLAGQCTNTAVMIDWAKYCNKLLSVDVEAKTCVVEPGIVLDVLNKQLEKHDLRYGPEPATHPNCTLGGMIGNNSCGATAQRTGKVVDNLARLEVVLYDGTRFWCGETSDEDYVAIERRGDRQARVYRQLRALRDEYADEIRARYPDIPRRVSGYNLDSLLPEKSFDVAGLLVGSESTLITVLHAELELVPVVKHRSLVVLGFENIMKAADAVPAILPHEPIALEGLDHRLIHDQQIKGLNPKALGELPTGTGYLMVQFGGDTTDEADQRAKRMLEAIGDSEHDADVAVLDSPEKEDELWQAREAGLGTTAHVPGEPDTWEGWEDSAVGPDRLGDYLRDLEKLYEEFGFADEDAPSLYGHFGQGCVHTRIPFRMKSADGVEQYRRFLDRAADLVSAYGGSLSGEHGDGQARGALLPKMFGDTIVRVFGQLKAIFDPDDRMNPGKVVPARQPDANLRLGSDWSPRYDGRLHFAYPEDDGSFVAAANRCVGVGKCRQHSHDSGSVMCPSYQVTLEEEHSTRGRARLLFEMLHGHGDGPITDGWRSSAVHDALDLCLACKGCKSDCPVDVDMATYKAEFLAHHYEGRVRPRSHYAIAGARRAGRARAARRRGQRAQPGAAAAAPRHPGGRPGAARDPVVRRGVVAAVVAAARRVEARVARNGAAVAGHVHEPVPPAHRQGRRRGARERGLDGHPADLAGVLRAHLDLDRAAGHRQEGVAPRGRHARRPCPGGGPGRRPGTELHRGVSLRRGRPAARRPGRPAAEGADGHPRRTAHQAHGWVDPASPRRRAHDRPGPLPPARGYRRLGGGRAAAQGRRRRQRAPELRLLWAGRQLRLREGTSAGQRGMRRTGAAAGPAGGRRRVGRARRWVQLPHPGPRARQRGPGGDPPRRTAPPRAARRDQAGHRRSGCRRPTGTARLRRALGRARHGCCRGGGWCRRCRRPRPPRSPGWPGPMTDMTEPVIDGLGVAVRTFPTPEPEADGTLTWEATTAVVVVLHAGGRTGLGWTYSSPAAAAVVTDHLQDAVRYRNAMDVPAGWGAMRRACRNLGTRGLVMQAISAVDIAWWDLKAQLCRTSLTGLLGAARSSVPIYGSGGFTNLSHDQLAEQVEHWRELGCLAMKIKIGEDWGAKADRDLDRVAQLRCLAGAGTRLMVDANGAYDVGQARRIGRLLDEVGVVWFEEPVSSDNLEGLATLRSALDCDVAAGEYAADEFEIVRLLPAVDCLQLDATRCGGYTGWLRGAALAQAAGRQVSAHCAPALHAPVAAAVPNLRHVEYFADHERLESQLVDGVPPVHDGALHLDRAALGHGMTLRTPIT